MLVAAVADRLSVRADGVLRLHPVERPPVTERIVDELRERVRLAHSRDAEPGAWRCRRPTPRAQIVTTDPAYATGFYGRTLPFPTANTGGWRAVSRARSTTSSGGSGELG
jgi:hypothetical protein